MTISPRIHILGERHSGTNLASELAQMNFDLIYDKTIPTSRIGKAPKQFDFGINKHKHNIQSDGPYERGLSIISIRNPYDYTNAMIKECYQCGPQERNSHKPGVFVGSPWDGDIHADNHHFDNLMVMRKAKYCKYLEQAAKLTDCIMFVHSEDNMLPTQQLHFVWKMAMLTGWPMKQIYPSVRSEYAGHARGTHGDFSVCKLIKEMLYFKTKDLSPIEGQVIDAVNTYMEKDFEEAMGYLPMELPTLEDACQGRQRDRVCLLLARKKKRLGEAGLYELTEQWRRSQGWKAYKL